MSDRHDRQAAWDLLCEYTKTEPLRKHALAVEAAMRAYARKFGGDEELWAIVGLLHDFDYEAHPNPQEHPVKGAEIMRQRGWPEEIIYAVMCHADYLGLERRTPIDRAIYAVDELTGLIIAVLCAPSGQPNPQRRSQNCLATISPEA